MMRNKHTNLHLLIPIFFLFPTCSWVSLALAQNETIIPVHVGVILDDLQYSFTKDIWLSCIKMAVLDFYATHPHYNTRIVLNTRHCKENVVSAAAAALNLIKNEQVKAIIGPVTSTQTSFVINLGNQAHVPIISFSATSLSLTSPRMPYFFQFAQTDSFKVKAISAIVKAFGWRQVVPIYIETEYGVGIIQHLTEALHEVNAHVAYRSVIPSSANDGQILQELSKLMTMETRVFIVHMTTDLSSRLFVRAKEIGMMSKGYVWLTTSDILNKLQSPNSTVIDSTQGVLGVQNFVPPTPDLEELKIRLKKHFHKDNPVIGAELDVFGLWAYDAVFAVAMAIEQVVGTSTSFPVHELNSASNSSTDLEGFPVSLYGPKLLTALSTVRFEGIAGHFTVVGGTRNSSNFQIVNVDGGGARTVGFWTLKNGLANTLNSSSGSSKTSSSKFEFGPIRWPGDSLSVPKGWEIPAKGKKLRILVPVKVEFTEFVKVAKDPKTNATVVTGFSIDVFKAAVKLLPYDLPYELIPFANSDGTSAGTYNQMCYQVYLGNFDAVVGDIIIRADRSLFGDFTMPYLETGVAMVVPVIDFKSKHVMAFLRPWTWDLWLTICFFFVYVGFVVWVLEHRINKEFRGPLSHQVGTSIWFSCSTMVFAHRERVVSNLARFVMIIWLFAVLILTINYTASLSSLYTVEQLQPTVTDIEFLLRSGDNVGCIKDNFSCDLLKQVGFYASKLKEFEAMKEIDEAFSKGTAKGGIAAFVHITSTAKLFVGKYCPKYTLITPIFETNGYAFVFPKRSPLVADVSQAILNITGGEKIMELENKWLKESSCQDSSDATISSNSRGLGSFWVLFLIAGLTSVLVVVKFIASFIYRHRYVLVQPADSELSTWRKIQALFKIFNEKDRDSHTFGRKNRPEDAIMDSPNNFPGALVHPISDHIDQVNSLFIGEQQTSSIVEAPSDVILPSNTEVVITVQEMHRTISNRAQE